MKRINTFFNNESFIIYYSKNSDAQIHCIQNNTSLSIQRSILFLQDFKLLNLALEKINSKTYVMIEVEDFKDYANIEKCFCKNENVVCSIVLKKDVSWLAKVKEDVLVFSYPVCFEAFFKNIVGKKIDFSVLDLPLDEIKSIQNTFYLYNFENIKKRKDFYCEKVKKNFLDTREIETLVKSEKQLFDFNLLEKLNELLVDYFTSFFEMNYQQRNDYINNLSKKLLIEFHTLLPEAKIVKPFLKSCETLFLKEDWVKIGYMFEVENRIMGNILKNFISQKINEKNGEIVENCNHILMGSFSDRLGNLINLIEQKAYLNNKLLNELDKTILKGASNCHLCNSQSSTQKIIAAIKEIGTPVQALKDFSFMQSKMFRSYKNEVENNCTGRDIVEMFEFVFINGFKAKTSSVDILVFNTIDEAYRFSINEYIIVNSLYAIIENAIEAKAKEISIVLSLDEEQRIQIEVSNNGTKIRKNEVPYLFEKCFTRKKKHYGNGLAIARDWLQSNKCSIVYCEDKQCFRIKISKDLKEGNR